MTHGIFISYSDFDKDKVNVIIEELTGNTKFFPIVIASNREALKPLAKKVEEGIIGAKIIVPILTKRSIKTQWINQEIGFATAAGIRIMPIVEKNLINKLKGFIHKEIDLPYGYNIRENKVEEMEDFLNQFRNLLSDLDSDLELIENSAEPIEKSAFEISLEKADQMNEEIEFKRRRKIFLESNEGIEARRTEVLKMFADIEKKIVLLKNKGLSFGEEMDINRFSFILRCEGMSFGFELSDGELLERYWKGNASKGTSFYFPGDEPVLLTSDKYCFDRNRNNELCWLNLTDKKNYFSEQIVNLALNWMVEQVFQKKLT